MLREYVISEAMHALGVPTTRSLAVVATGRPVQRETPLPGAVLDPRRRQPPAGREASNTPPRTGDLDLLRRLADHAIARHYPGAADDRQPLPRAVRGGRRRPGIADRPVDADRLHPRRDEHRQHDDLRRDDRLRAVRLHGGLRPRHGVQLDRPVGPLRLRQPARDRGSGTSPGSPRRCCRYLADTVDEGDRARGEGFRVFGPSTTRRGRPGCGTSSASPRTPTPRPSRR